MEGGSESQRWESLGAFGRLVLRNQTVGGREGGG